MTRFPTILFCLLWLCGGVAHGERVDPTPVPLPGTVMLHGGGRLAADTLKTFYERGGNTGRVVVITTTDDAVLADQQAAAWAKRPLRKAPVFGLDDPGGGLHAALAWTAGVWIEGSGESALATPEDEVSADRRAKTGRLLWGVLERGGAIGGSARELVDLFGETLLPGVVIGGEPVAGRVAYQIDPLTAAAIIGRHTVVTGPGKVRLSIAASDTGGKPVRRVELSGSQRADHLAWRRSAIAREKDDFPPAEFPTFEPISGTVVVMGGGRVPRSGLAAFITAAGGNGAPIAVINTALGDPPPRTAADLGAFDTLGATNTYLLHARTRAEASGDEFIAQIDRADGVWFTGGRQWRLVDRYLDTAVVDALHRVLARSGAVGGTSAGATICGDYLVRGDPISNRLMMAEGYEQGFGLLPGLAIDQHFDTRKRLPDLLKLKKRHPGLLAVGIDEATAAIITGSTLRVAGLGTVTLLDRPLSVAKPRPGDHFTVLNRGDRFDLKGGKVVFRFPSGVR